MVCLKLVSNSHIGLTPEYWDFPELGFLYYLRCRIHTCSISRKNEDNDFELDNVASTFLNTGMKPPSIFYVNMVNG